MEMIAAIVEVVDARSENSGGEGMRRAAEERHVRRFASCCAAMSTEPISRGKRAKCDCHAMLVLARPGVVSCQAAAKRSVVGASCGGAAKRGSPKISRHERGVIATKAARGVAAMSVRLAVRRSVRGMSRPWQMVIVAGAQREYQKAAASFFLRVKISWARKRHMLDDQPALKAVVIK